MTKDGMIHIFPAKRVGELSPARVVIVSPDQKTVILAFDGKVAFSLDGFPKHPDYGFVMVLTRDESSSPFWRDVFTEDLFGIMVAE